MTEHDQHSSPIKTPKQLVIVVVLAFIVPIVIIGLLSQLFTSTRHEASQNEQRVLERIKPVGTVVIADASGPHGNLTGAEVYAQVCKTCHEAGLAGAPKTGDKAAWGARIVAGEQMLVQHAIAGFQGKTGVMPPKGGNMELTDEEVHRAVVYLANQVGAGWKEPAPTAVASTAPAPASAAAGATNVPPGDAKGSAPPATVGGYACRGTRRGDASAGRRCRSGRGEGRRQGGLRKDLFGLSRNRTGGCTKVRRQGRMGAAHCDGNGCVAQQLAARQERDAAEGRQHGTLRCRRDGRRRLHGRGSEVNPGQRCISVSKSGSEMYSRISGHGESNDKRSSEIHL